jgi:hypothetical protein
MKLVIALTIIVFSLIYYVDFSDANALSRADREREKKAQAEALATPQVIRDVDGCKVYRFMDSGYWRYFARCATQTTTTYEIPSGKSKRPESITTENAR